MYVCGMYVQPWVAGTIDRDWVLEREWTDNTVKLLSTYTEYVFFYCRVSFFSLGFTGVILFSFRALLFFHYSFFFNFFNF